MSRAWRAAWRARASQRRARAISNAPMTLFTRSHELHLAAGNRLHGVQDLLNLSSVETMRDHHDQALSYAEEALAAARDFGLIELLWCAEYAVATCRTNLARDSDDGSGGFEPFEEALAGLRRAADVVELLRSKVDSPEGRESLLGGKEKIYEDAVILCIGLGRAKEAFEFCERARMRSFLEALGSSRLERLEAGDPGAQRRGQLVELLLSPRTPPGEKPACWMSYGFCARSEPPPALPWLPSPRLSCRR